jgi:dienelactone hydrolase
VVCEETVGRVPAKANPEEMAAFKRLLSTKTFAFKNAPAAAGQFPVVIYHPGVGGTPEDNSALFEFLASHGYVVISSVYQDEDGYSVHGGGGDLPCAFRDMEFLSRYARRLPFADADQLGAMGHSLGGWEILAWAAEPDSSLRAFVSLDSGLEYDSIETSGVESLQHQMKINKDNIRAPSLRVASLERKADFNLIGSYLRFTNRYEATAIGLTHNDFLTHGAIRPILMPRKWPDPKGVRRSSYDQICKHVLAFLDATLKRQGSARKALDRSVRGEGVKPGFALVFKAAVPRPPSPRQLSQYVKRNGLEKGIALMRSLGKGTESMSDAAHVLLQDGDVRVALSILRRVDADHPNRVSVQALLGQALFLSGDRAGALAAFRKGKAILDSDKSATSIWKYSIEEGLKELGQTGN